MAASGIFELVYFAATAIGDVLVAVDVSDSTQAPQGSTKAITVANFFGAIPTPIACTDTTDSSSSTTGSITTAGGLGVAKKLFVGTGITVSAGGVTVLAGTTTVQALTVNGVFSQSLNLAGNVIASFTNTNTGTPNGMVVAIGGTPNNSSQFFWSSADGAGTGTARAIIFSNGGLSNYSANNVNLSDARTKKPGWTPLAYDFDQFERISVVRYQYKDQTHTDDNFGVIADELELVDPHFVDEFAFGPKKAMRKMVYEHDLFYAHMDITQQLQRRVKALEAQLATGSL